MGEKTFCEKVFSPTLRSPCHRNNPKQQNEIASMSRLSRFFVQIHFWYYLLRYFACFTNQRKLVDFLIMHIAEKLNVAYPDSVQSIYKEQINAYSSELFYF